MRGDISYIFGSRRFICSGVLAHAPPEIFGFQRPSRCINGA
nr:MAG TPA: hypothetical protein [Caudoviricetes sp.]